MITIDEIKKEANQLFATEKYGEAEKLYSKALEMAEETDSQTKVILHTNRSAARFNLGKWLGSLEDADAAILLDKSWMKGYYRKACVLEKMSNIREAYHTWVLAFKNCERSAPLVKQFKSLEQKWIKIFRDESEPIESQEDLLERYKLLTDKRERLSTLAHFWNDSSPSVRLSYFHLLLSIIGGQGAVSEFNRNINEDCMIDMPLHNYPDLTRERMKCWCDYFKNASNEEKKDILHKIWYSLSSEEMNDVIVDLRLFITESLEALSLSSSTSSSSNSNNNNNSKKKSSSESEDIGNID